MDGSAARPDDGGSGCLQRDVHHKLLAAVRRRSRKRGGSWLVRWPHYVQVPLKHDFQLDLLQALDAYGRVPAFAVDGTLLD